MYGSSWAMTSWMRPYCSACTDSSAVERATAIASSTVALLNRLALPPMAFSPTGVVFACASGFTEEARRLVNSTPSDLSLVLVGGRADGGFDVALPDRLKGSPWAKLFELEDVDLTFTDEALTAIAQRAIERKTGARGLRSIIEAILLDTMFDLPTMEGVTEVVVDKDVVEGRKDPVRVFAETKRKASGDAA